MICYLLLSPTVGMHQYTADLANRAAAAFGAGEAHLVTTAAWARDRYAPDLPVQTPVSTTGTGFAREGLQWAAPRRALATIERVHPDVVHITGVHAWNVLLARWLRRHGIPVVHTLHDLDPHHGVRHAGLIRLWNRLIVGSVVHILVHGECYRQRLQEWSVAPERVTSVPLLHLFLSHAATQRLGPLPQEMRPRSGPAQALFFGRVEAYKGADTLLAAWSRLGSQARLVIAGPVAADVALPPLPPGVELRDRLIGDEEALALFGRFSLLVLPYRDATQSALVAAAYYFGLPVIVTRTGALPEYVVEGETGWVVPPDDPAALAAALDEALADPARLRWMGQQGQEWYRAQRNGEELSLSQMYAAVKNS
ncbi:MAG: glycosyltransferase [Chloroflexi bacterium]|nr:glycosyltransferase [Chloroflexota bacterium]